MLKNIPCIIPPELLKVLSQMGHGDEITLGDANFPGESCCQRIIRMDGHGVADIIDAILELLPLDQYVALPAALMSVTPGEDVKTPIWDEYRRILAKHGEKPDFNMIPRFDFYDRVKKQSFAVIMTGERALYANIILKKGVIQDV